MSVPKTAWNVVEEIADSDAGGWLMEFTAWNLLRERDALKAENQQLRDALEQIIEVPVGPWRDFFTAGITIARQALCHHD